MLRADSQPPFDADAYMQGRQDSTLTGDGSCTLAAASADQISQLERQFPALNGNGPTVTLNGDTSKMIEMQRLESLLHLSFKFVQVRVSKPAIATICCRHAGSKPDPLHY